jgi:hypothetical protein
MAIHELYTRIVEELEKDPDFWDKHMRLLDDAFSTANDEEKQLIDVAIHKARKDRILMGLSVRLLNGEDELTQSIYQSQPKTIIGSKVMTDAAKLILKEEMDKAYRSQKAQAAGRMQEELIRLNTKNRYNV